MYGMVDGIDIKNVDSSTQTGASVLYMNIVKGESISGLDVVVDENNSWAP